MADKVIQITESQLRQIIAEEVSGVLMEYAISNDDFYRKLDGIINPILDNLISIAVFHAVNPRIVFHWVHRAVQLPSRLFNRKPKSSAKAVVRKVFAECFGEHYEDIDASAYQRIIDYYEAKPNNERMAATLSSNQLHERYTPIIIEALEGLKESLIKRYERGWGEALNKFQQKISSE